MATTATATKARATKAATVTKAADKKAAIAKAASDALETKSVENLVETYHLAAESAAGHKSTMESAERAMYAARVLQCRMAYRVASHPSAMTAKTEKAGINKSFAATALDKSYSTLHPYVSAGQAMGDRAYADDVTDEDIAAYVDFLEKTERARQKEKRAKEKAKAEKAAAAAAPAEGEGEGEGETANADDALTFSDIIVKANELLGTTKKLVAYSGTEGISDDDRDRLEDVLSQVASLLAGE